MIFSLLRKSLLMTNIQSRKELPGSRQVPKLMEGIRQLNRGVDRVLVEMKESYQVAQYIEIKA